MCVQCNPTELCTEMEGDNMSGKTIWDYIDKIIRACVLVGVLLIVIFILIVLFKVVASSLFSLPSIFS